MIEHHIEREIIDRLLHHASLRFSELKPDGMESNIFMYHLNQLIKAGYIVKTDHSYRLTHKGLQYVDKLSSKTLKPRQQPKVIAILALSNEKNEWLLAERKIQPYIQTCMFPSGKQHYGESLSEHAARELQEKVGLSVPLTYRGIVEIRTSQDGAPLTHVLGHVHSGVAHSTQLPSETEKFRYIWHDFTDQDLTYMAGTLDIYKLLQTGNPFTAELAV